MENTGSLSQYDPAVEMDEITYLTFASCECIMKCLLYLQEDPMTVFKNHNTNSFSTEVNASEDKLRNLLTAPLVKKVTLKSMQKLKSYPIAISLEPFGNF